MKRHVSFIALILVLVFTFSACAPAPTQTNSAATTVVTKTPEEATKAMEADAATPAELATFIDFDGNEVTTVINPKTVAIYDYAILDMLESIGFAKTGITTLVVPAKDSLPTELAFYKDQPDDVVITGGTLFYIDMDVLDLVQPELVILGSRSFGTNADGDRLSSEEVAETKVAYAERYAGTAFAKLSVSAADSSLLSDMERNVDALKAIFPVIADDLQAKLDSVKADMAAIAQKAEESKARALFAMMVDQTSLSIFMPNSRFDMLYEEFGFASVDDAAVEWDDQHGFDVRAEYVLEKNPDVIFLLDRSATVGSGAGAENFLSDPIIQRTTTAKEGHIYVLHGAAWYTMTGGFTSAETMIADLNQYFDSLDD